MKRNVFLWIGLILLMSLFFSYTVLADSGETSGTTTSIPIQSQSAPVSASQLPSPLPSDKSQVMPPTGAQMNPNPQNLPPSPGQINVSPVTSPGTSTPPSGSIPAAPSGANQGALASPVEPVINNYSPNWWFSPWFISLMVIIAVIMLLVVYSLLEGRLPKEEKETETAVSGKKKKNKK